MKLHFAAVLILVFAFVACGQNALTIDELSVKTKTFKDPQNYLVNYDKIKNQTSVIYGAKEPIKGARTYLVYGSMISFSIGFDFPGQTLDKAVENYNLAFYFWDKSDLDLTKNQSISILVQGYQFNISGGVSKDVPGFGFFGKKKNIKTLTFQIKHDDLQLISIAPEVEINLDSHNYKLNRKQHKVLKDIVSVSKIN